GTGSQDQGTAGSQDQGTAGSQDQGTENQGSNGETTPGTGSQDQGTENQGSNGQTTSGTGSQDQGTTAGQGDSANAGAGENAGTQQGGSQGSNGETTTNPGTTAGQGDSANAGAGENAGTQQGGSQGSNGQTTTNPGTTAGQGDSANAGAGENTGTQQGGSQDSNGETTTNPGTTAGQGDSANAGAGENTGTQQGGSQDSNGETTTNPGTTAGQGDSANAGAGENTGTQQGGSQGSNGETTTNPGTTAGQGDSANAGAGENTGAQQGGSQGSNGETTTNPGTTAGQGDSTTGTENTDAPKNSDVTSEPTDKENEQPKDQEFRYISETQNVYADEVNKKDIFGDALKDSGDIKITITSEQASQLGINEGEYKINFGIGLKNNYNVAEADNVDNQKTLVLRGNFVVNDEQKDNLIFEKTIVFNELKDSKIFNGQTNNQVISIDYSKSSQYNDPNWNTDVNEGLNKILNAPNSGQAGRWDNWNQHSKNQTSLDNQFVFKVNNDQEKVFDKLSFDYWLEGSRYQGKFVFPEMVEVEYSNDGTTWNKVEMQSKKSIKDFGNTEEFRSGNERWLHVPGITETSARMHRVNLTFKAIKAKYIKFKWTPQNNISDTTNSQKQMVGFTGFELRYSDDIDQINSQNNSITKSFKKANSTPEQLREAESKINIAFDKKDLTWKNINNISDSNVTFSVKGNDPEIQNVKYVNKEIVNNQVFIKYSFEFKNEKIESKYLVATKADFRSWNNKFAITGVENYEAGKIKLRVSIKDSSITYENIGNFKVLPYDRNGNSSSLGYIALAEKRKINEKEFYILLLDGQPYNNGKDHSSYYGKVLYVSESSNDLPIRYEWSDNIINVDKKTGRYTYSDSLNATLKRDIFIPSDDTSVIAFGSYLEARD
ncbi:hypothetical protein N9R85_03770, partial [Mycoplasma sp. CSL7503-lung]|nr:hypothetical protein [Mycoplasma sp. CSL7503-lung]